MTGVLGSHLLVFSNSLMKAKAFSADRLVSTLPVTVIITPV
ncbi:hypothetical protein QFZ57_000644 [Arthrobacter sp. B1I2]|nr:hypothetical protein [Arthrobacter sp. B1I2]